MPQLDIALPGFVKTTRTKYDAEMARLKGIFGSNNPDNWPTLQGEIQEAAFKYVNNIYFCEDTSEIFNKEVCYGAGSTVQEDIEELMNAVFTLSWKTSPRGGTYEIGQSVTPSFNWAINRKGTEVNPTDATVDGSSTGVAVDKKSFTATAAIKTSKTYALVVKYNSQQITANVAFNFQWKKYWGVSEKETLSSSDIIAMSSDWASSKTMSTKTFNCSGGKYPYYCLPKTLASNVEVWVNGLRNTDIITYDVEVTNASGSTTTYTVIRLATIQNSSSLSIEFK